MLYEPQRNAADVISLLSSHKIYKYGSAELLKFEKQMIRYFSREYDRWRGNHTPPEHYGASSFKGDNTNDDTQAETIDHYNKELRVYQAFLDSEYMCYTMGYFDATDGLPDINNDISLSHAQTKKFDLIIERAEISDGQNILELGCGFGGFAKYLLNTFPNIRLTAINPCKVQTDYIRDTLIANNVSFHRDRFTLVEKYFDRHIIRDLKNNEFDRIVSIGALEHFSNYDLLFQQQARLLKPGGKCLHHLIVSKSTIPNYLNAENTRMGVYFPGGHIWPYSELTRHDAHLRIKDSWFNNGMNYWKTLDEWHKRFWNAIDRLYPEYLSLDDVKIWNEYFVLCKTMFYPDQGRSYGVGQYLYQKD